MQEPNSESIERSFELERVVFFSDAVFAIAITLLAIELKVPEIAEGLGDTAASQNVWQAVASEWTRFLAFAMSFYIIGAYWIAHHRYFRYIHRYDDALIRINLVFLFFVVLLTFTTGLMGEYGYLPSAIVLYALNVICVGLAGSWLWHHSTHDHKLVEPDLDAPVMRRIQLRSFITPLVAVIVIALAFVASSLANFGWFFILLFNYLLEVYLKRGGGVKEKRAARAPKSS
jgi:uncharacterized membrane protein